jgi:hypothetical protein
MFGSFLAGGIGRLCQIAGVVLFMGLIVNHAPAALVFIVCIGLIVIGSFLRYLSRHTVRVRR